MRAWRVTTYGRPTAALELLDVPTPEPGPGEILVRNAASVLNYNEVDACHGRYLTVNPPLPYTLGMQFAGEVTAAGTGAEHWIGRRVMGISTGAIGSHAEQVIGMADMAFDVPAGLENIEAAAFYLPFHLAYLGLHERGRLQAGETVLVHAAAGGVGSAAVQLAVAAGAHVIATAGGAAKGEFVRSLGAHTVIDYRAADFVEAVLDETDGRGVDVCFDGVGGDVMAKSLRCLARNGRHLVVGFASGIEAEEVPMVTGRTLCFGNFSILGVIMAYGDPALVPRGFGFNPVPRPVAEAMNDALVALLAAGKIHPVVGSVVPAAELPQAMEAMEDRSTVGRVVVTW